MATAKPKRAKPIDAPADASASPAGLIMAALDGKAFVDLSIGADEADRIAGAVTAAAADAGWVLVYSVAPSLVYGGPGGTVTIFQKPGRLIVAVQAG